MEVRPSGPFQPPRATQTECIASMIIMYKAKKTGSQAGSQTINESMHPSINQNMMQWCPRTTNTFLSKRLDSMLTAHVQFNGFFPIFFRLVYRNHLPTCQSLLGHHPLPAAARGATGNATEGTVAQFSEMHKTEREEKHTPP